MEAVPGTPEGSSSSGAVVRTFLIADIRGYSTFTRKRGDEAAARLATRFANLARDAVEARSGEVLQLRGDEALAVFDSTPQAVRAGLEFQLACAEETTADPDLPLPVGVGIDCGEAVPVEDGYRGAAINMAARLCSKALAGQVLVTRAVTAKAEELPDVVFESLGVVELKGWDQPVELLEVSSTREPHVVPPPTAPPGAPLPPELDDFVPIADRESELRWLRGTWRQARRGHGRIVFVSGPAGIGKTRLAAELAVHVQMNGGAVRYAGSGGAGGAETLAVVTDARSTDAPTLYVLDDLNLYEDSIRALRDSVETIESRPALVVGLFRDAEGQRELAALVQRVNGRGDGHRRLGPLGQGGVNDIARSYVGDVDELPAESMLRASGGVPARVHEVVSEWTRDEAKRRLTAAAEWLATGKSRHAAGLDFANNVIALKLGRIYEASTSDGLADECPYKGLAAFEASDAAYFYGRERLVGELAARTVSMGLLGVVGPSGSGKSSVVLAGLLPSLAAGLLPGSERWGRAIVRPGEHPMDALEQTLLSCDPGERLVLVVDQFEEVFTTSLGEPERAAFVERLVELASDPERTVVVVTIRADYTGHCAAYPELAELLTSNLVLVGPMAADELRRAIELPARRAGLRVETALADALVEEVADEPGGLPLLSTALVEQWQVRDDGWMRREAYERTGGVRGAVARLAEASYGHLTTEEREAARTVLLRLVGEGEGESAVRRRVPVTEFDLDRDPTMAAVLQRLTGDRLLTRDDGMIEIAHEALIREWPRLRGWLEEDATDRQLRTHLTQAAKQWEGRGRDSGELYRGARLSATLDWAQGHDRELNELEREFLAQGRQASEREAERQRRTNRRLRGLLIGTAVFLAVALLAGALALIQRGRAERERRNAVARELAAASVANLDVDPERSILLALEAIDATRSVDGVTLPEAEEALHRAVTASRIQLTVPDVGGQLDWSPDGVFVTEGPENTGLIDIRDASTGKTVRTWKAHNDINDVRFSPDGSMLATAGDDGTLRIWDPANGGSISLVGGAGAVGGQSFDGDGSLIAAAWPDQEKVQIADTATGRVTRTIDGLDRFPFDTALAPNGDRVAVSMLYGDFVDVFDVSTGRFLFDLPRHRYSVFSVSWSPDGRWIASGAADSSVRIWNGETGKLEATLLGHTGVVNTVDWAPDSRWLVSGSSDGSARVWEIGEQLGEVDGREVFTLAAQQTQSALFAAFAPDGKHVITGDIGITAIKIWDVSLRGDAEVMNLPTDHLAPVDVAALPDGRIAASDDHGSVSIWNPDGTHVVTIGPGGGPDEPVWRIAATPDGSRIATVRNFGGIVSAWDTETGHRMFETNVVPRDELSMIDWSPDGRHLAASSFDGSVTILDSDGERIQTLQEPGASAVEALSFSPDGRSIAVGVANNLKPSESHVSIWDWERGVVDRTLDVVGPTVVSFDPDGSRLAIGRFDGSVQIRDVATGDLVRAFVAHSGPVGKLAFSPDGTRIATGGEDGTVRLFDARTGERQLILPGHDFQVSGLAFSGDGTRLVSAAPDGVVRVWALDLDDLIRIAKTNVTRELSDDECRQYLHFEAGCP